MRAQKWRNMQGRGEPRAPEQGPNQNNQPTWKILARRQRSPRPILWAQVQTSHRQGAFPSFPARGSAEAPPHAIHRAPTNSAPSTFYLRLRAFSITCVCGTHGWTANGIFHIHHSSAAAGGMNPAAEGVEEESSFGRPALTSIRPRRSLI